MPNDISCTRIGDTEYLTFTKRMGACPDNCFRSRYWKYQIHDDCDISFIESHCKIYDGIQMNEISKQIAFPNPFTDYIQISEIVPNSNITIYNIAGEVVYKGHMISEPINLGNLENGNFLIAIKNGSTTYIQKLIKRKR